MQPECSIEYLNEAVRHEEGRVFWKVRPRFHFQSDNQWKTWNTKHAGKELRHMASGRIVATISGRHYYRGRIVFALAYGRWPIGLIDHKDQDTLNDRIENLRECNLAQNAANSGPRLHNRSGFKGVGRQPSGNRYRARITIDGATTFLGNFMTPEDAAAAYREAASKHHGEFACSK